MKARRSLFTALAIWTFAAAAALAVTPIAARAQAPAAPAPPGGAEADAVRCWWRTDKAAIRMGEPFTAVLTCAVLETASTKAVVDRSRLDHTVMALPPFDVLGGTAAEDVVAGPRRFFQYSYELRLLSDTAFGQDMSLTGLSINYRIDTATKDGTTSQGRDLSYNLPPLTMRVLSLVAGSARDIRDATTLTFADLEARRFRARSLGMAGWFLYGLAGAVLLLGLARLYKAMRAPARAVAEVGVSEPAVLAAAARELSDVARQKSGEGWTEALTARAAGALRIVASYAIGKPAAQIKGLAADAAAGQIALSQGLVRRRHALVSAAITPKDLAVAAERDGTVQQLRDGLIALTASRYGRAGGDDSAIDTAIAAAGPLARSLSFKYSWPMRQVRKLTDFVAGWKGR
jgi:hypothetical protein